MAALILSLTFSTSNADSSQLRVSKLIKTLTHEVDGVTRELESELKQTSGDLKDFEAPTLSELLAETELSNHINQGVNSLPLGAVLEPLSDLLCPIVGTVDDAIAPVPVASDVTGVVRALVCNLGQLSYSYYTVWEAPNGDLVKRSHQAVLGVPTPIDVDNDPTPDLIGTIDPSLTFDSISLSIDRAPNQSTPLAASVEAVIDDLGGFADKEMVSFGYDQLDSQVPSRFEATFAIPGLLGGGEPVLDVDVSQQNPGASTDLIGDFFNGTPRDRTDETSFRLAYENSPNETGLLLNLGDPLEAQITTDVTGPLVASLSDNDGAEYLNARAAIRDLPNVLNLSVGAGDPRVAYTGEDAAGNPQAIEKLNLTVDSNPPLFGRASNLRVTIEDLPSGTEVSVDGAGERLGLNASRAIGSIEAFAGSEAEQAGDLPPEGEQGANYFDKAGEPFVLGARIFELEQLEAGLGDAIELVAKTAGGPFDLHARLDDLEADAAIRDLPPLLNLGFNFETGAVSYAGSNPIDRINVDLRSASPLIMSATDVSLLLQDVPEAFELGLAPSGEGLQFAADNPLGKIEVKATSPDAPDESDLLDVEDSGAVLRDVGGDFFLFARLFDMRELGVNLDPISLVSKMQAGRVFMVDAKLDQAAVEELPDELEELLDPEDPPVALEAEPIHIQAVIDKLPSEVSLSLADVVGTKLQLIGSELIDLLKLDAKNVELLEGADSVKLAVHELPTEVTVELPEEGPLADISANDHIGQLRLAAAAGEADLPARSINDDPVVNDKFQFRTLPDDLAIALRLTAVKALAVNLDPVNISLQQDNSRTRPIDLDAALLSGEDDVNVAGLLNKPGTRTSMSVQLDPDQPTALVFDNSHNMQRFELTATGLSGISAANMKFDNLSPRMTICMDPGPACQRPNPTSVARYSGPNVSSASMDFDDHGTHGSGSGPDFRTTLNALIAFDAGAPITIENLRFRNLGFDFVDSNNPHNSNCGSLPRMSVFFDSRGHPFVMNALRFPPQINLFRVGTDSNPARARTRSSRINGWATGFLGCLGGFNQSHAGALSCGGAAELRVQTPLGNINILNFLTFQFNICGGTVSNPQPW